MSNTPWNDWPDGFDAAAKKDGAEFTRLDKRIAELEAALRPFALSAEMMKSDERSDEDVADLVCGTDLTPSDFWTALHVMTKSASST